MNNNQQPALLMLNQMAGPLTWELAEDLGLKLGCVALLTGHPDTLQKSNDHVLLYSAERYQRGSLLRRALSWLRYCLEAMVWLRRWPAETPILLFSNPPFLCWIGWLMKSLRRTPFYVMVHDIYPDVLVRVSGIEERNLMIRLWRELNKRAYERAELVLTVGKCMEEILARQFEPQRTHHGQIEVIYPWVDTDSIKPIPKEENWFAQQHDQVGKLTIMYSGNMGLGHDIETILEAARILESESSLHFVFIGTGPKKVLVDEAVSNGLKNVSSLDWQPENVLPYSLATADIGLVSLEDSLVGLAIPSKLFYMMAAGSALVGLSKSPSDLNDIIMQNSCGVVVNPGDVNELVNTVRRLQDDEAHLKGIRSQSREAARSRYARPKSTDLFFQMLTSTNPSNS